MCLCVVRVSVVSFCLSWFDSVLLIWCLFGLCLLLPVCCRLFVVCCCFVIVLCMFML